MSPEVAKARAVNTTWTHPDGDEDYLNAALYQKSRARVTLALLVGSLLVSVFCAVRLVWLSQQPPQIIGYSAGYYFTPSPAERRNDIKTYYPQWQDTIEVLFQRTEKGSLPQLAEFLGAGVKDYVDQNFTGLKDTYRAGFVQSFKTLETRYSGFNPSEGVTMLYRGIWSIRATAGMETQSIYLRARFVVGNPSALNATGWRLTSISPVSEDEFYASERTAERDQRLGKNENSK